MRWKSPSRGKRLGLSVESIPIILSERSNCYVFQLFGRRCRRGRYAVGLIPALQRGAFPLHTLLINLGGAILIGMAAASAQRWTNLSPTLLLFWRVGICGGFTTFSTFSLESLTLLEHGRTGLFALYALLSVALCLVGVWLGKGMVSGFAG